MIKKIIDFIINLIFGSTAEKKLAKVEAKNIQLEAKDKANIVRQQIKIEEDEFDEKWKNAKSREDKYKLLRDS